MRGSAALVAGLAGAVLAGCSGTPPHDAADGAAGAHGDATATGDAGAPIDAGSDGGAGPDGAAVAAASFVVTSTLAMDGGAGLNTHTFTMAIGAGRTGAIVGAAGSGYALPVATTSGGGYRIAQSFSISVPAPPCGGNVSYQELTFTIGADGGLVGTGKGSSITISGDVGISVPVTMTLAGVPDRVAPTFDVRVTGEPGDPFSVLTVVPSEPLPADANPRLVSAAGDELPLVAAGGVGFVSSFAGPATLLSFAVEYHLAVDGIADFAGNAAAAPTFTVTTKAAPPLVAEDGFESTTGATLGGAQVLSGAGAPIIDGTRSLYIAPLGASFSGRPRTTQLALRLAVAPGDAVVRFAYRLVASSSPDAGGGGFIAVGSVGGTLGGATLPAETSFPTAATIAGGGQVMLSDQKTAAIPLPAGAAGEIVFARIDSGAASVSCSLPPGSLAGIIIDDLRVE